MTFHSLFCYPRISVLLSAFVFLNVFTPDVLADDSYMNSARINYANQIQQALYNDNFLLADSLNNNQIKSNPNDPIGYLFQAAKLMAEMTDSEENLFERELKELTDKVLTLTEIQFEKLDSSDHCWFYLLRGHAYVYKSLWESRFGSRLSAANLGYDAKGEYEKGLKADSSCYDLYFGLGSFHFWKSTKAGFLRKIRIFSDDRKKGIEELFLARDSSIISKEASSNSLVWIWIEKEMYDSSITTSLELSKKYPDGKMFLWPLAESFFKSEMYEKALEILFVLREKLSENRGNYFNIIECDYKLLETYKKLKMNTEAKEVATAFLLYEENIRKKIRKEQRSKIKQLLEDSKK